jgi:hypothetical protein
MKKEEPDMQRQLNCSRKEDTRMKKLFGLAIALSNPKWRKITMINIKSYVWTTCLLAAVTVSGFVSQAKPADPIPVGPVAMHQLGRALFAANGTAQVIGYLAFIKGISGPLFAGPPSEATAFFTYRSNTFSPEIISNGDISVFLISGESISVYFNSSPHGDWNNPDSFSTGQLVATFTRREPLLVINVGTMFNAFSSSELTSSHEFVFNGQAVDFEDLFPHGLTWLETATSTFLAGPPGFVAAQPLAGTMLSPQSAR